MLYWNILIPLATPAYATVGAIIASRRPDNAVGWLCLIGGLVIGLQDAAWQYAARTFIIAPGSLPAGTFFALVADVLSGVEFPLPPTLLLLLFPAGHLVSRRWQVVLVAPVICTVLQVLTTLLYPLIYIPSSNRVVVNPIRIKGSETFFDPLNSIMCWITFIKYP